MHSEQMQSYSDLETVKTHYYLSIRQLQRNITQSLPIALLSILLHYTEFRERLMLLCIYIFLLCIYILAQYITACKYNIKINLSLHHLPAEHSNRFGQLLIVIIILTF